MKLTLKITSLVLMLAFSTAMMAQKDGKVSIIPTVGLNYSNFNTNLEDFDQSGRPGWEVGVDMRFGKYLYFTPGVHYSASSINQVNLDQLQEDLNYDFSSDIKVEEIKVPIGLGLKVPLIGVRVEGGVVPTYVIGMRAPNGDRGFEDAFNRMRMSTSLGVGMDLLGFLSVDATWEKGLSEYYSADLGIKNNTFAVTAGIRF